MDCCILPFLGAGAIELFVPLVGSLVVGRILSCVYANFEGMIGRIRILVNVIIAGLFTGQPYTGSSLRYVRIYSQLK